MLPNTITLDYTPKGASAVTDVFRRYDESGSRTVYIEEGHTSAIPHELAFYRTPARPSGDSKGVQKCAIKFTDGVVVKDRKNLDTDSRIIGSNQFNLPVGCTAAQFTAFRAKQIALWSNDEIMDRFMNFLEI